MKIQISLKKVINVEFHPRKPWVILVILLLFLVLSSAPATAITSKMGPDGQTGITNPISTLPLDQFSPVVAYASQTNEYLVAFEEVHSTLDHDVYAIYVDNAGNPIGSLISIDTDGKIDTHPGVAYSTGMDRYLVVWENEYELPPYDRDIYAELFAADGTVIVQEIHVTFTTAYDEKPVVVYNPGTQDFLVVFERHSGSDELVHHDLIGKFVSEDGIPSESEIIIANGLLDEQAAAVASDGTGYLVVWQGDYLSETNIYGQRISGAGLPSGGQIGISTWEGDQYVPRVTYNNGDLHYFVVWEDHHYTKSGIYGYRLDRNGNLVEPQVSVSQNYEVNHTNPDVAYLPGVRSYEVVWQYEYGSNDHDIYSRRVAYDGSQPEPEFAFSNAWTEEMHPSLASNGGSQSLVTWEDWRNYADNGVDIFGALQTVIVPSFSGAVYQGNMGEFTNPLQGVTVQLGCSNDYGYFGELIVQKTTNNMGEYQLPAYILCEYYNIQESDPDGYYSVGSQASVNGEVYSSNWIYYTYPLTGKALTGNYFWDKVIPPADDTPPDNWANFQPTSWVNTQTVLSSEQVEDTLSGLDISTAGYRFSIDGGSSWVLWSAAMITGNDESTDPQVISASVPFSRDSGPASQNLVQFRVADMVGNIGTSPPHPVKVDSVLPINPSTISSSSHTPNICSNNTMVSIDWSGASDDRSGIYGYSTSWNQNPDTIPDNYRDTDVTSLTNNAIPDSDYWWFHVRTIDNAGNAASGAVHYGPFCVDTDPPTAWITTAGGVVNLRTINIGWAGGDTLSRVHRYDVQTDINGAGWTDWQVNVQTTSAPYTGANGQAASFRVRAIDSAGNVGDWSSTVSITFGVDVLVQVKNDKENNVTGAEVYFNGQMEGETLANGMVTIPDVLVGDLLSARYMVEQHTASKGNHNWLHGPNSWSYRTYITSIDFDNLGNPQIHVINNTGVTQVLHVRNNNALIGFYMLVSVEWDASTTYLNELRAGLESASQYLYDVTDGQMLFEVIDIWDNKVQWDNADIHMLAQNNVKPCADPGGIWQSTDSHIFMGRYWSGNSGNTGSWTLSDGYRTFIHEFGHYGMYLFDEYIKRSFGKDGQGCTIDRKTTPAAEQASFMDFQYTATEMCSTLTFHPHNTNTAQDALNGGPCWETVFNKYRDNSNPERWVIERPSDRGSVMPGPQSIPISQWTDVRVTNANTSVCGPFETTWVFGPDLHPATLADVWVKDGISLYEGLTYTSTSQTVGVITILGAHNGDVIRASKSCGPNCAYSGVMIASCSPEVESQESVNVALTQVVMEKDPFSFEVSTQPEGDGTILKIMLQSSTTFPQVPQVEVWQDGATEPINVTLLFDGGIYRGNAYLDPAKKLSGHILANATDTGGNTVYRIVPFTISTIAENNFTWLKSSDGQMEIYLPEGSLTGNTAISIQSTYEVNIGQDKLSLISKPYEVRTSTGENSLQQPATLNIYYSLDETNQIQSQSLGLYQWDATNQNWVLISTTMDDENHFVSAEITQLGTFAILGSFTHTVALPIVYR